MIEIDISLLVGSGFYALFSIMFGWASINLRRAGDRTGANVFLILFFFVQVFFILGILAKFGYVKFI